jgi:Pyridoxamine 5'-phosphate oxidase
MVPDDGTMTNWNDVMTTAPELAADVRARFEAHGLGLLATLRADGSPRISGIEPWFGVGELWIGMMWQSLKARDLLRDPRLSLHSATVDTKVEHGDARVSGRAVVVDDDEEMSLALGEFAVSTGNEAPPGPMHLFRIDVTELMFLRPAGDHLDIRTWSAERGERLIERR